MWPFKKKIHLGYSLSRVGEYLPGTNVRLRTVTGRIDFYEDGSGNRTVQATHDCLETLPETIMWLAHNLGHDAAIQVRIIRAPVSTVLGRKAA